MTWQPDDLRRPVMHVSITAALVLAFAAPGTASAQQTVYVGGSGKIPVEVHMEVLDQLAPPPLRRVVLDPPGQAPLSAFLLNAPPVTATIPSATPLIASVASLGALSAPQPKPIIAATAPPLPEPAPATEAVPLTPVITEPLPPAPVAAPEPSPSATVALAPPEPEPLPEPVATPLPEPVATPLPEPVATPLPEPVVAAVTPQAAPAAGEILSIPFASESPELPGDAEGKLRAIAEQLAANDALRAQVKAYADGSSGSASTARRLSLSRALAVRSVLIELGVRSTRIDVRALGDRNEGGAPDRVDILVINR